MLITNFASGELSEDLFGRIDMPQYFQGVSHLENFDVVPTGGIIRRRGMRRMLELPEEGRIIPFIINRDTHILLFLSPGKISTIVDGVITSTVVSSDDLPLYGTLAEIDEVQYAQTAASMVMTHVNYHPVRVQYKDEAISINLIYLDTGVEVEAQEGIESSSYQENDLYYTANGYLAGPGHYPASCSFVNGRLVFAGTIKNPQRLFFSKVNDITKFSTYRLFLTEKREYVVVRGSITDGSKDIDMAIDQILQFKKPMIDYYCESDFFIDGTKISKMMGTQLTLTSPAKIQNALTGAEEKALEDWLNAAHDFVPEHGILYFHWEDTLPGGGTVRSKLYGAIDYKQYYRRESASPGPGQTVPLDTMVKDDIKLQDVQDYFNGIKTIEEIFATYFSSLHNIPDAYEYLCNRFKTLFDNYYQYTFRGHRYVNYPDEIYAEIIQLTSQGQDVYIPFYTREIIEDRHPIPDDGFTFEIASDMSDAIKWIGQNKNLLVGTETAEWVIPSGVNATNIQAIINSRYGSDNIQGTSIGDAFCFIQTGRKAIVEYYIPQQDTNFRANNMAMLSKNMLHESPVFDFDFVSAPYTKIFISREDGTVVCLLYERLTGTFAWGRITTQGNETRGYIKSVATLPGEGQDEVYFVVERSGTYFLERLDGRGEAVYLDGFHEGAPGPGEVQAGAYSGFSYESRVRSMPVLANDRMKNNVIKSLSVRFQNSYFPRVRSLVGVNREVQTDSITREEPYSGIVQIPFPGQHDRDVFFEFVHNKPTGCHILAVNAEAN